MRIKRSSWLLSQVDLEQGPTCLPGKQGNDSERRTCLLVGTPALGSTGEIQAEPDSSRQPGIDLAPQRSLEAARRLHQAAGVSPPLSPSRFDSAAVRQVCPPTQPLAERLLPLCTGVAATCSLFTALCSSLQQTCTLNSRLSLLSPQRGAWQGWLSVEARCRPSWKTGVRITVLATGFCS